MFVDIIKAADLGWLDTDNDQQSYQRLSQLSARVRFGRWWTFWAYYVNKNQVTTVKSVNSQVKLFTSLLMETALVRLKDV